MGNQGLDGSMACSPEGPNELVADRLEPRAVFFSHHLPVGAGETSGSRKGKGYQYRGRKEILVEDSGRKITGKYATFQARRGTGDFCNILSSVGQGLGWNEEKGGLAETWCRWRQGIGLDDLWFNKLQMSSFSSSLWVWVKIAWA